MSGKVVVGLTCPACGGQITLEEGDGLACCKFCGSFFALDAEEGVSKIMYRMEKTADDAKAAVRAWMKSGKTAKNLENLAKFTEVSAAYLPFWRLIARGKACVCGYTETRDSKGNTTRHPHEALVNREYVYSEIACEAGDLGVRSIQLPEGARAVSADTADLPAFPVTVSKDECRENGYAAIRRQAIKDGGGEMQSGNIGGLKFTYSSSFSKQRTLDKVTFSRAFCIPKGFSLIYYPFYIVRYDFQGRSYMATVDGITGRIVSGRAPGNTGRQSWFAGIGGAAAGTIAGAATASVSFFAGEDIKISIAIIIFAYVFAGILLVVTWKQFRDGGEVLTGYAKGRGISHGKQVSMVETMSADMFDYYG
ncbi:MAG: hypothetical protein Q4Q20_03670 [Methanocorpusculum sp.]|nr:hypothetical protein [Methanocorpusculum sp.]